MFKRIITVSVLGVSALGMMAANATTTNGFYVDGQVGYAHSGNEFKKWIPSDTTIVGTDEAGKSKGGIAGRLAIGYQFTPNWAVELGYLQLGPQKSSDLPISKTTTIYVPSDLLVQGAPVLIPVEVHGTGTEAITLNQHAFDVVGKGIYPINDKFSVYAKAGMAYLTTTVKSSGQVQYNYLNGNNVEPISAKSSQHNWAPEGGIGLTYNVTPNVFIDTSFTHIQPIGKKKLSNIDFATVGIGYSFG